MQAMPRFRTAEKSLRRTLGRLGYGIHRGQAQTDERPLASDGAVAFDDNSSRLELCRRNTVSRWPSQHTGVLAWHRSSGPRGEGRLPSPVFTKTIIFTILAIATFTFLMPSAHAAGGASLPCGVTGTGTISCTQNYAAFIPGGSCVVASTSLSFPNGSNSSGFEHLYAGSSVLNTCNGTANWGTIGSYAAVVCNPGSQILAPSCEDRARFEFVIRDGTIHATSAGTISVGGDFYLYGFLQNSGFIQKNPLPGSGQGLGT